MSFPLRSNLQPQTLQSNFGADCPAFFLRWTVLIWAVTLYLWPNSLKQIGHLKSKIFEWLSSCRCNLYFVWNLAPQVVQHSLLSSECVCRWTLSEDMAGKALGHCEQRKSRDCSWYRLMCLPSETLVLKLEPQRSQKKFMVASCSFMWHFAYARVLKRLLHVGHSYCGSLEWISWCRLSFEFVSKSLSQVGHACGILTFLGLPFFASGFRLQSSKLRALICIVSSHVGDFSSASSDASLDTSSDLIRTASNRNFFRNLPFDFIAFVRYLSSTSVSVLHSRQTAAESNDALEVNSEMKILKIWCNFSVSLQL